MSDTFLNGRVALLRSSLLGVLLLVSVTKGWTGHKQQLVDSLQSLVEELPADSNRVWALLDLSKALRKSNQLTSIQRGEEALTLSRQLAFDRGTARVLLHLSRNYSDRKNYLRATEYVIEARDLFREFGDRNKEAQAIVYLGKYYGIREMREESMQYFDLADEIYREVGDDRDLAKVRHNRAVAHRNLGDRDAALALYQENLDFLLAWDSTDGLLPSTYNNMANILRDRDEFERAEGMYQKALALKLDQGNTYRATTTASNLADVYVQIGRIQLARQYIRLTDSLAQVSGNITGQIDNVQNKARLAHKEGRNAQAFLLLDTYYDRYDSLHSDDRSQAYTEMLELQKQTEEQLRLDLLASENERILAEANTRQGYFIAALSLVFFFLALVVGLLWFYYLKRRKNQQLSQQNQQIQAQVEALNHSNARLEDLYREQLALIQVVAHDLKAPLNKTLGLLDLMDLSGQLNPEQQGFAGMLRRINEDAGRLVGDLLALHELEGEGEQVPLEELDAVALFRQITQGYQAMARNKEMELQCNFPQAPLSLYSRRDYLQRILDNLVSNALKFSPSGSKVQLELRNEEGKVVFVVRDQGPGFSPEDQVKMYQKFQKLSARPTGGESSSGLGLSIVRNLTDRLQGEITLTSQNGRGAEFEVQFTRFPKGGQRSHSSLSKPSSIAPAE